MKYSCTKTTGAVAVTSIALFMVVTTSALAAEEKTGPAFTEEELSVAEFWEQMGPTLRDEGVDAYAVRYHPDFRSWAITSSGGMARHEHAVRYWSKFHEDGHRITCTNVIPITIDIVGDRAFARFIYEQTNTYSDDRDPSTGVWRMVDVFVRYGDTWQVLESNMVSVEANDDGVDPPDLAGKRKCPT